MVETEGSQRLSVMNNKALNNDEANGCARRVHFTKFIMEIFEYYPLNWDNAVQVGPQIRNQAVTNIIVAALPLIIRSNFAVSTANKNNPDTGINNSKLFLNMKIENLLNKPLWQMTDEEFMFLSKSATSDTAPRQSEVTVDASSPKFVSATIRPLTLYQC